MTPATTAHPTRAEEFWLPSATLTGWFLAAVAALLVYTFAPHFTLLILGALAFIAVAAIRMEAALGVVLLTAPLYRFPREIDSAALGLPMTVSAEFTLLEFAILAAVAGWLIRVAIDPAARARLAPLGREVSRVRPWLLTPAALLVVAAVLSLLASEQLGVSLRELRRVIIEPLLFAGLLTWVVRSGRDVLGWLDALILLGLGMAAFSLFHYQFIGVVERTGGVERVLAIYHSPNELALFLGRILPVAVVLLAFRRPLDPGRTGFYAVATLAMAVTVFITYSRGAWIGVTAAVVVAFLLRGTLRWLLGAIGAVVVAAVAIVASGATERVLGAVTGGRRLLLWQSAVAMIRDHPLQGVGMDNFLYQYRERYILPEAWQEPDLSHPHNILLDFWTRLGVLGVVVIVWLQVVFWRRGLAAVKLLDGALAVAALALLASMTDFLVHGLIDNSFFLADLAVLFWFSWVLMGRLHAIRTQVSA